jgi:hypothetical protein
MFYVTYMFAELRRRLGRTILTALGLGIGVGLVVTVTALSNGLDEAQAKILEPLTGVGTDMSVSRPIEFSDSGNGPFRGTVEQGAEAAAARAAAGALGSESWQPRREVLARPSSRRRSSRCRPLMS